MLLPFFKRLNIIVLNLLWFIVLSCSESHPVLEAFANGTSSLDVGTKFISSESCQNCHQKIHSNWSSTSHGKSYSNVIFQTALKVEPKVWCLNCHAPLHNLKQDLVDIPKEFSASKSVKEGVNCAVCHVRNDKIYGKNENLNLKEHPIFRDDSLAENAICNQCHQFNFPLRHDPATVYNDTEMQSTGREFSESFFGLSGGRCQSCHLAKLHKLEGSSDRTFLRKEIKVKFSMEKLASAYNVNVKLEISKIGHAFPTGDLFRAVSINVYGNSGNQIAKHFIRKNLRVKDAYLVSDTRLYPSFWKKGIIQNYYFELKEKPKSCEIIYHYQFPIEDQLKKTIREDELKTILYSGTCD